MTIEPKHFRVVLLTAVTNIPKKLGSSVDGCRSLPYNRYFARHGSKWGGFGAYCAR